MSDDLYFPGYGRQSQVEEPFDRTSPYRLENEADYLNLRRGLEEGLAGHPREEAESHLWRNSLYRLSSVMFRIRDRQRDDAALRRQYRANELLGERYLTIQRLAQLEAGMSPEGVRFDREYGFVLWPEEFKRVGMQCVSDHLKDGYLYWEWNDPELSFQEYAAVEAHIDLCHHCAGEVEMLAAGQRDDAYEKLGSDQARAVVAHAACDYVRDKEHKAAASSFMTSILQSYGNPDRQHP